MSQSDLMKLFSDLEEVDLGDFTPEELYELLASAEEPLTPEEWKQKYFEFYDDVKDKSLKKQDW